MIGNFITDFIGISEESQYPGSIRRGIELHRLIDSFTDEHRDSRSLRSLLRKRHGKYASVAVDLVWDFFLCKNWSVFSGQKKSEFANERYDSFITNKEHLPENLRKRIDLMVADDFLLAYDGKIRARRALAWMDRRTSFPSRFHELIIDIEENHEEFDRMFLNFFPEIIQKVESHCVC